MGPDWQDASVVPVPLSDWNEVGLRALKVAFYTHHAEAEPTAQTAATTRAAAKALEDVVESIEEALPARIAEVYDITRTYWRRTESRELDTWAPTGQSSFGGDEAARHLFEWAASTEHCCGTWRVSILSSRPQPKSPPRLTGRTRGPSRYSINTACTSSFGDTFSSLARSAIRRCSSASIASRVLAGTGARALVSNHHRARPASTSSSLSSLVESARETSATQRRHFPRRSVEISISPALAWILSDTKSRAATPKLIEKLTRGQHGDRKPVPLAFHLVPDRSEMVPVVLGTSVSVMFVALVGGRFIAHVVRLRRG